MGWLIAIIALVLLFLFLRKYVEHKVIVILLVLLFVFIFISFVTIAGTVKSHGIDYKTPQGLIEIGKVYMSWISQVFTNLKTVTGNVVNLNWQGNFTK